MSHDYLPIIMNALADAAYVVDDNRRVLLANDAAETRFGKQPDGQDFVRTVRHPGCLQAIDDVLNGAERAQALIAIETPVRTNLEVNVSSLGINNEDGARAIVIFSDVSHVRQAEQMRSDFVANVSHELRSPLTALSGFIETLQGAAKDDTDARIKFLALMAREAHRMNRLIGDLLSLSKVEANERLRPMDTVDIQSVIERVIATLAEQAHSEQKAISFEPPDGLDPVSGDDDELTQVFQNLIVNAIKYGAAGTIITISIEELAHAASLQGPALAITVSDQGRGLAAEHIARLTERFYRVDDSRSRDKGGTGLGLAIVKHIINRHRGKLHIKSEQDVGSSFTVVLPASTNHS